MRTSDDIGVDRGNRRKLSKLRHLYIVNPSYVGHDIDIAAEFENAARNSSRRYPSGRLSR